MPAEGTLRDPFLQPRDPGEEAANDVVREFLIRANPPAATFRQDGTGSGYALIVPNSAGERLLTVPGRSEADFKFHGSSEATLEGLVEFIVGALHDSGADHLKLPLSSRLQAGALRDRLVTRLPGWRLATALSSVAPFADRPAKEPTSLRRAATRAQREGWSLELPTAIPLEEVRELHAQRWGNNRGSTFLTAVLGCSWRRLFELAGQRTYSFGRGSERYKFRYASGCRELYELRGFFGCGGLDRPNPGAGVNPSSGLEQRSHSSPTTEDRVG